MQSSWGPRIFWLVVFILAGLGIYVYFSDPADEFARVGFSAPLANMVSIGPKVGGCRIQIGMQDHEATEWLGEVKLAKGKILQLYAEKADPSSIFSATRFECKSQVNDGVKQPVILHVVYLADQDDTLLLTLTKETQKIPLADLAIDKGPLELFAGAVRMQGQHPVQLYENDSPTDDHNPVLTHAKGTDYLLYMNSERSKGIDVNSVLAGSFESLETPIIGTTLRLSRFHDGAWQYSEAVTPKLESCINAVAAMDATGSMYVAWIQKSLEGWNIYYQSKDYGNNGDSGLSWSKPIKLTAKPGYYQQLVAATDSKGYVWLAWQTWHHDHCEIYATVINHDNKHFMKTPGPVAEHPQDVDGRWFPALAADHLGNMYLAWTVFRQGHFDIEVMKLHENMVKSPPVQLVSSSTNALRPSLACDKDNQLWVAYEESEPAKNFGDISLPVSRVRVRTLRTDGSIDEWPLVATLKADIKQAPGKDTLPAMRCYQPCMVVSSEGQPFVVFQTATGQYYSRWSSSNWSEPKLFNHRHAGMQAGGQALYQNGQIVGIQEMSDWKGRVRLQFATAQEQSAAVTIPKTPAPATKIEQNTWKPFSEMTRHFRKRPDELVLSKRYLLRGLVTLPGTVNEMCNDPWAVACMAIEQSLYDWILIPQSPHGSVIQQWQTAQHAHLLSQQGDRSALLGSYRPMVGQREPLLLIDGKKDELPLVPLTKLESYRKSSDKAERISVTQAADRTMMSHFLSQRQRLGFSLTDDWRLLPVLTQPQGTESYNDSIDRMLLPLWHPEETPARKMPEAMRVVAFANGKSNDHLLEGLCDHHFYTATDDIYLVVRCEKHLPGDVFQTSFRPEITLTAQGTSKIKHVEIWQDNKLVKGEEPPGQSAILKYTYEQSDGQWHSYTVRVVQENGAEAVAQPFWIRYIP